MFQDLTPKKACSNVCFEFDTSISPGLLHYSTLTGYIQADTAMGDGEVLALNNTISISLQAES